MFLKVKMEEDGCLIQDERTLVFWHKGDVFHRPIAKDFSLLDVGFPTLSDLITFYQLNALPIPPRCKLGNILPKSDY